MIKFFKYEGNPNILRCVRIGDDGKAKACVAVIGVAKMLKNIGLVQRVPEGKKDTWLIIDWKGGMRIREAVCKATAKQWVLDQHEEVAE